MMGRRLDADIYEWAQSVVHDSDNSNLSGINVVERILRDPGRSSGDSPHRVHWWPKNRRIAKMSRLMHQVDKVSQLILIIDAGVIGTDDQATFDKYRLAKCSSISVREFNKMKKKAKAKLVAKLYT